MRSCGNVCKQSDDGSKLNLSEEKTASELDEEAGEQINKEDEQSDDQCNIFTSSRFCELLRMIAECESEEQFLSSNYNRIELITLSPRQYLEETVVPILMEAMSFLVRERPPEPINALCVYLLKYKSKFEKYCNTEPPAEGKGDN